jgi:ferredoxin
MTSDRKSKENLTQELRSKPRFIRFSLSMPTIEFLLEKQKIKVGKFSNLKAAAKKHGIHLGSGVVEVVEGEDHLSPKTTLEKTFLKGQPENYRLAGQTEVLGDVCIITSFAPKPSRQ